MAFVACLILDIKSTIRIIRKWCFIYYNIYRHKISAVVHVVLEAELCLITD